MIEKICDKNADGKSEDIYSGPSEPLKLKWRPPNAFYLNVVSTFNGHITQLETNSGFLSG